MAIGITLSQKTVLNKQRKWQSTVEFETKMLKDA